MSHFKSLLLLLSILLFVSCAQPPVVSGPPAWIKEQPMDTKLLYGVGSAPFNMKGFPAQKQAAMAAAIDVIARQKKIKVQAEQERLKTTDKGHVGIDKTMSHSVQTVENVVVNAKIKDEYHDRYRDVYYVLMVE